MDNVIEDKNPLNSIKNIIDENERVISILDDTYPYFDSHRIQIRYIKLKKRLFGNSNSLPFLRDASSETKYLCLLQL